MKEKEGSHPTFFPWGDVEACRNKQLEKGFSSEGAPAKIGRKKEPFQEGPADKGARGGNPCPTCGTPSQDLTWIYFVSPPWSWKELCGRAGWITVCDDCHVQVQFFCDVMN